MNSDFLKRIPLTWRDLTFWALPALLSECDFAYGEDASLQLRRLEVFISPSHGYYYRLERIPDQPTGRHSGGWRLEAMEYGNEEPVLIVSRIPPLVTATFAELIAAMGVLSIEATEPWNLDRHDMNWSALQLRWCNWLRSPAPWMKVDSICVLEEQIR